MEKRSTLVLDINELYSVIPEAKVLEGKNFKDVRELLKELIAAVEETGEWEFIQHVQNKPSLFVVRQTLVVPTPQAAPAGASKSQIKRLEERINTLSGALEAISAVKGTVLSEKLQETIKEVKEEAKTSVYDNDFYKEEEGQDEAAAPKSTLPWEQ